MARRIVANCAILVIVVFTSTQADPPDPDMVESITSQRFDVQFQLDDASGPADATELWYTTDEAKTWARYNVQTDVSGRIPFVAAEEGLYGFLVIAKGPGGASAESPARDTPPQYWAFVDFKPPAVQVYPPSLDTDPDGRRRLSVRWSAIDSGFGRRPIELAYRKAAESLWQPMKAPVDNTGHFQWSVPDELKDDIVVRLTVRDRVGHDVTTESEPISLAAEPARAAVPTEVAVAQFAPDDGREQPQHPALSDNEKHQRAKAMCARARDHVSRGEYRLAASLFQDALATDPKLTDALVGLGEVLYAQGNLLDSADTYQLALLQQPHSRNALTGLAKTCIGRRRFDDAMRYLTRVTEDHPDDGETWLHLGDVAVYQGNEMMALEHYRKAAGVVDANSEIAAQAKRRIESMKNLVARYRQPDDRQ